MKLMHSDQIELEPVYADGAEGANIRWLIAQKDGAPNFAMRLFEVEPGGYTPFHKHAWEHEIYCLSGSGHFVTERGETPFGANDFIYVDPEMMHQFKNVGDGTLKFLCLIPHEEPIKKKTLNPFAAGTANNC